MGTRFHVERISAAFADSSSEELLRASAPTLLLVASPSEDEPCSPVECAEIVEQLRKDGLKADWMDPFGVSQANSAVLLKYCRDRCISFLVSKRKGNLYRVRGAFNTDVNKDFAKFEPLVTFLKSRCDLA